MRKAAEYQLMVDIHDEYRQQAKKILSVAFVQELLNKIKIEPIKTYLSEIVSQHMSKIK